MKIKNVSYLIEIGKGKKGRYTLRNRFYTLNRATMYYSSINVGLGYKKRLVLEFDVEMTILDPSYNPSYIPISKKYKERKSIILTKYAS